MRGSSGGRNADASGVVLCFFFQAEDGIRDIGVTGVQTCALPIPSFKCLREEFRHILARAMERQKSLVNE